MPIGMKTRLPGTCPSQSNPPPNTKLPRAAPRVLTRSAAPRKATMKLTTASFGTLFVTGLVALSYGASQHSATAAIVGGALMLTAGIGGFLARKHGS